MKIRLTVQMTVFSCPAARRAIVPAALALVLAVPAAAGAGPGRAPLLVQLRAGAPRSARTTLVAAGGTLVVPRLRVWKLAARNATAVLRTLRAHGALSLVERERLYSTAASSVAAVE